jgi:hypothetical protein
VVYRVTVLSVMPLAPWRVSRSKAKAGMGTRAWFMARRRTPGSSGRRYWDS